MNDDIADVDPDGEDEDGDDDFDYDEHPDLPVAAGAMTDVGFEPDDDWIRTADRRFQHEAMRKWFLSRYTDPAMETPYITAEGGYIYVYGGPYDAEEKLYDRFGDVVSDPDKYIRRVVDDVESDGISDWAPIHYGREDEYDDRFDLIIETGSEPLQKLRVRLEQSLKVLSLQGDADARILAERLVFASTIGAIEAFLYEVAYFWINTNDDALRSIITKLPKFREEKMALGDIFTRMNGLKDHAKGHLQNTVWHRWDQVAQIYRAALGIELPSVKDFEKALLKRHDIVHRSGHDKDGHPIATSSEEIAELCTKIEAFAVDLEQRINSRGDDF